MHLALNNLQWLICHKIQQTKPNQSIGQIDQLDIPFKMILNNNYTMAVKLLQLFINIML